MVTSYIVKCSAFQCSVFRIRRSMFLNSLFAVRQWRTRLCEPDLWPDQRPALQLPISAV